MSAITSAVKIETCHAAWFWMGRLLTAIDFVSAGRMGI
jgi:hypothetical protein